MVTITGVSARMISRGSISLAATIHSPLLLQTQIIQDNYSSLLPLHPPQLCMASHHSPPLFTTVS